MSALSSDGSGGDVVVEEGKGVEVLAGVGECSECGIPDKTLVNG